MDPGDREAGQGHEHQAEQKYPHPHPHRAFLSRGHGKEICRSSYLNSVIWPTVIYLLQGRVLPPTPIWRPGRFLVGLRASGGVRVRFPSVR